MKQFKVLLVGMLCLVVFCFWGCSSREEINSWNVEDYKKLKDIVSIENVEDEITEIQTYKIKYKSDDCKVVSYLSVPEAVLEKKEVYPCILFARGGNRDYGAMTPKRIAGLARNFDTIVFSTQYRGVDGGTGTEEFGGADVNDVIKLIDLCEKFTFVDMEHLYMVGASRGGMMAYQVIRQDERIKKAVIVSGMADAFMCYEERPDMRKIFRELVGDSPQNIPEEYEKRSATYWADEIQCPVLIIHTKQDARVSYAQAEKMAECLENAGKEYEFISFDNDIHGLHPDYFPIISEWLQYVEKIKLTP